MKHQKIIPFFLTPILIVSLAQTNVAMASRDYIKTIRNDSTITWIIVPQRCNGDSEVIQFDAENRAVCSRGSVVKNGLCFLPPGMTTSVAYKDIASRYCAQLAFTDGMSSAIFVKYKNNGGGVGMESSNPRAINDSHGNITIYRNN